MKLKYYCRQIWIASTKAGIAQNGQKRLIFLVVPPFLVSFSSLVFPFLLLSFFLSFFFFFFELGKGAGTLPVQTMRLGFRADAEVNTFSKRKTFTNIIRRCQCFQFVVTHFQPKIQNFNFPDKWSKTLIQG